MMKALTELTGWNDISLLTGTFENSLNNLKSCLQDMLPLCKIDNLQPSWREVEPILMIFCRTSQLLHFSPNLINTESASCSAKWP